MAKQYRVLKALSYPPKREVEAGEIVNDIPKNSVAWLLENGLIEDAGDDGKLVDRKLNAVDLVSSPGVSDGASASPSADGGQGLPDGNLPALGQ